MRGAAFTAIIVRLTEKDGRAMRVVSSDFRSGQAWSLSCNKTIHFKSPSPTVFRVHSGSGAVAGWSKRSIDLNSKHAFLFSRESGSGIFELEIFAPLGRSHTSQHVHDEIG